MQTNPPQPTLHMNDGGARKQVPLRDYLNARIAPFLKKAMTESIASEAEFPLQWLGEHLIHQSMLYEGNPDSTNIRERFRYNFETPSATQPQQVQAPVHTEPEAPNGIEPLTPVPTDAATAAAAAVEVPAPPDATMTNGDGEAVQSAAAESTTGQIQRDSEVQAGSAVEESQDVDMAGTT